jgi:hypothetical protein
MLHVLQLCSRLLRLELNQLVAGWQYTVTTFGQVCKSYFYEEKKNKKLKTKAFYYYYYYFC